MLLVRKAALQRIRIIDTSENTIFLKKRQLHPWDYVNLSDSKVNRTWTGYEALELNQRFEEYLIRESLSNIRTCAIGYCTRVL